MIRSIPECDWKLIWIGLTFADGLPLDQQEAARLYQAALRFSI